MDTTAATNASPNADRRRLIAPPQIGVTDIVADGLTDAPFYHLFYGSVYGNVTKKTGARWSSKPPDGPFALKFRQMATKHPPRWPALVGGGLLNVALGTYYAWSVFVPALEKEFGWTRTQTSHVAQIDMVMLASMFMVA